MFDQLVVVRFRDGSLLKGSGESFFPGDEAFEMMDEEGKYRRLAVDSLAAVFFVRSLEGNPNRQKPSRSTSFRRRCSSRCESSSKGSAIHLPYQCRP